MTLQRNSIVRLPISHDDDNKKKYYKGEGLDAQNVNDPEDVPIEYAEFTEKAYQYIDEDYDQLVNDELNLEMTLSEINQLAFKYDYGGRSGLEDQALPGKYRNEYPESQQPKLVYVTISLDQLNSKIENYPQDTEVENEFTFLSEEEKNFLKSKDIDASKVKKYDLGVHYLKGLMPSSRIFPYGFLVKDDTHKGRFYYANPLEISSLVRYAQGLIKEIERMPAVTKEELLDFNKQESIGKANRNLLNILSKLAHVFRCLIVSHPFLTVNNSIIMILINYILEKKGFYQIPNLRLDIEALFLNPYDFQTHFIHMVREYMLWEWD